MTPAAHGASIVLSRDCPAILVPVGQRVTLHAGDAVVVLQSRGGVVTVRTERGFLARIGANQVDALGMTLDHDDRCPTAPTSEAGVFDVGAVIEQLRGVFDPEIPVSVVDLGLVYRCEARPLPDGGHRVEIAMSMTAPGCGMGDVLKEDARLRVEALPGVEEVIVELVWDPPWTIERMTQAARLELGLL